MLIALGVAAEVVVVIQDENRFVGSVLLAIENCRRQPTQAGANHHQIIVFSRLTHVIGAQTNAPSMLVRHGIGTWMAAPQPGQAGWVSLGFGRMSKAG